ncbi:MAG: hypothetical protein HUJ26_19370 [Planctomycetaceae bacterium]|nr:hypothetical protein [Planctomycetaceae bacterium]
MKAEANMSNLFRIVCLSMIVSLTGCDSAEVVQSSESESSEFMNQPAELSRTEQQSSNSKDASSEEIFRQRLLPIFSSPNPSSCTECHLSSVALKDYIRPSAAETFSALVTQGLVNVDDPKNSKILTFIKRAPDNSSLVQKKVRQQEFDAFRDWILAAVADPNLVSTQPSKVRVGPKVSDEVIRHARMDRVLASFIDNVWTEVGRCAACHSPDQNHKQVAEHGEQVSWIKLNDPITSMKYMTDNDLIDVENPEKSLLLLKPTMQIEHGGGKKMVIGDRTYKQFRRFIDDYAAIIKSKYTSEDQLPKPSVEVSIVTDIWMKIENIPEQYDQQLMQVDIYQWTEDEWSEHRVATSDRLVFGKGKLWQHSLSLTAFRESERAKQLHQKSLSPGRYLAKVYVDQTDKLKKEPFASLNENDLITEIEFQTQWKRGYGRMTKISWSDR